MSKEIKDYLYLYLGCIPLKAIMPDGTIVHIEGVYRHETNTYANYLIQDKKHPQNGTEGSYMVDGLKPILRPLSDMTEDEFAEMMKQGVNNPDTKWALLLLHSEITRWLLSKHFDIFQLIESGLAIDATTLKLNT